MVAGTGIAVVLLAFAFVGSPMTFASFTTHAPTTTPPTPGSGGCPSAHAIGNFLMDTNVSSSFSLQGNGSLVSYFFSSTNETPSGGVPGLISYCVYPNGSLPSSAVALAVGANGAAFTVNTGAAQGYFSFARANGNPSNLPLDGTQGVAMGNATWPGVAPVNQSIVLHINDAAECALLYGGNPGTCFVYGNNATTPCSSPGSAPAALRIAQRSPTSTLPSGATLGVEYQLAVVGYTGADSGSVLYVPSVNVHFLLAGGGNVSFYLAPSTATITSGAWTNPVTKTVTLAGTTTFNSSAKAWLSTANLAVLFSGPTAGLTVEARWAWVTNVSGTVTAHWTVPQNTAKLPNYPSIFSAAPYVGIVSTSANPAGTGSYFGVVLSGAVNHTWFKTLVETVTGKEMRCQMQSNAGSSLTFEVGVPLTDAGMTPLAPGKYVLHIHDAMGAIVRQVSLTVA